MPRKGSATPIENHNMPAWAPQSDLSIQQTAHLKKYGAGGVR